MEDAMSLRGLMKKSLPEAALRTKTEERVKNIEDCVSSTECSESSIENRRWGVS